MATNFHGLDIITVFSNENSFLSNFHPSPIVFQFNGSTHNAKTVEHAYQASKSVSLTDFNTILNCSHPAKTKQLGKSIKIRHDWRTVKLQVMNELVRAKFNQNSDLKKQLIETGNKLLVEGNNWNDCFWGVTQDKWGENWLGRILMDVRNELRDINSNDMFFE